MHSRPIGVFDSGIGGMTFLASAIKEIPGQKFIYFGDNANAPYGTKTPQEVIHFTVQAVNKLIEMDIKALVIACNTATSAAIDSLRDQFAFPIIGMEPALKLAVDNGQSGTIVVMATSLTLNEKKFMQLKEKFAEKRDIISLPCPGLVELIEQGIWEGQEINNFLLERFKDIQIEKVSDIVLGCTHYIYIKDALQNFFDAKVNLIDGNAGTARQLKKILIEKDLYIPPKINLEFDESLLEIHFSKPNPDLQEKCEKWVKYGGNL